MVLAQIGHIFAHDMAEPRWHIAKVARNRAYGFCEFSIDLTNVNGRHFDYNDIGGPDVLHHMKDYALANVLP